MQLLLFIKVLPDEVLLLRFTIYELLQNVALATAKHDKVPIGCDILIRSYPESLDPILWNTLVI